MEEQLISFETAKLAKEKGFNLSTINGWWKKEKTDYMTATDYNSLEDHMSQPGQHILQKWLREKHKLDIWMCKTGLNGERYQAEDITNNEQLIVWSSQTSFPTYEEALEEGLQAALTLIKI